MVLKIAQIGLCDEVSRGQFGKAHFIGYPWSLLRGGWEVSLERNYVKLHGKPPKAGGFPVKKRENWGQKREFGSGMSIDLFLRE